METPGPFSVPQEEIDRALRSYHGRRKIYQLYQQELSVKERVAALKQEYGVQGGSLPFLDGTRGFLDYRPGTGMEFWRTPRDQKFIVKWAAVEKRIRQLIQEGSYLTPEELEQMQAEHETVNTRETEAPVPAGDAAPADLDAALQNWNGDMESRQRVWRYMADHAREKDTAAWLRAEYGGDLPAFPVRLPGVGQASELPWPKVQRRIAQLIQEGRFLFDGDRPIDVLVPGPETPAPTVREIYERYKPIVKNLVLEDMAYRNACQNSDEPTARLEGNEAVKRAAATITAPDFMRLYLDMPDFHNRLHREIVDETYAALTQPQREQAAEEPYRADETPVVYCEWSESAVFEDGKRYSVYEFDRRMKQADEAYVAGKNAAMEKYGTWQNWYDADDPEFSRFLGYDKVKFTIILPDGRLFTDRQDIGDGDGGLLDFLGRNDSYRDILPVLRQAVRQEEERLGDAEPSAGEPQAADVEGPPPPSPGRDPLAPAYKPGDTVYLDNTAFEITGIGLFDVELRDPALPIPLFRSESKENFERLLYLDSRNSRITSYLPANMSRVNGNFREVLTAHLLTERDKGYISGWLRSGENNRGLSQRLSPALALRAGTVRLESGEIAEYSASTVSMTVEVQSSSGTKLSLAWEAVAPILRALWLQELDGFTHEPVQREPVELTCQLTYQVGDKVAFAYGDHDVSGTIGYIGELDIRIDTGPYAWSHETVTKDFFEDALRHDERNAHLFTPELPAAESPAPTAPPQEERPEAPPPAGGTTAAPVTTTIYPADKTACLMMLSFRPCVSTSRNTHSRSRPPPLNRIPPPRIFVSPMITWAWAGQKPSSA